MPAPILLLLLLASLVVADERRPSPRARGKMYAWKSNLGIPFLYFVPRSYKAKRGADLVLVLNPPSKRNHITKLRWDGVAPLGMISIEVHGTLKKNGYGRFDAARIDEEIANLHTLLAEVRTTFLVKRVYVVGDREAAKLAARFAEKHKVAGVVALQPDFAPAARKDVPVVIGFHFGFPPHTTSPQPFHDLWPLEKAARVADRLVVAHDPEQGLDDVARRCLELCATHHRKDEALAALARPDDAPWTAFGPLYAAAGRVGGKRAAACRAALEKTAKAHAAAIRAAMGKGSPELSDAAWIGHLGRFLAAFRGVPACEALRTELKELIDNQRLASRDDAERMRRLRFSDKSAALRAGHDALRAGFLTPRIQDMHFWTTLRQLIAVTGGKRSVAARTDTDRFRRARTNGYLAFMKINRRYRAP